MGRVTQAPTDPTDEVTASLDVDSLPRGARGAIEAVLMVVEEPVDEVSLASALGITVDRVTLLLDEIAREYDRDGRGFALRQGAGGGRV